MSRTLPAPLASALRAEAVNPVWLAHIETGGSPADLRFAGYDGDVTFGGATWSARPVEVPEFSIENHNEAPTVELRIGDADGYFQTLLAAGIDLRGRKVRLYRTDLSVTGSSSALTDSLADTFFVEGLARAHGWILLRLRSLLTVLDIEVPLTTVTVSEFPGLREEAGLL